MPANHPDSKTKPHIPYLEMGPMPIYVGYAPDQKSFCKELRRLGIDDRTLIHKGCRAMCHTITNTRNGTVVCIVGISPLKGDTKEVIYSSLAHEAVHCWQEIEDYVEDYRSGKEMEAYTIGYMTQFFCEEYAKSKKK